MEAEVKGTSLPITGALGWEPGVGLVLLTFEISLLDFYLPHVGVGPASTTALPLLSVYIDVVSLIPLLSEFHSSRFLMVLNDGCSLFWL